MHSAVVSSFHHVPRPVALAFLAASFRYLRGASVLLRMSSVPAYRAERRTIFSHAFVPLAVRLPFAQK